MTTATEPQMTVRTGFSLQLGHFIRESLVSAAFCTFAGPVPPSRRPLFHLHRFLSRVVPFMSCPAGPLICPDGIQVAGLAVVLLPLISAAAALFSLTAVKSGSHSEQPSSDTAQSKQLSRRRLTANKLLRQDLAGLPWLVRPDVLPQFASVLHPMRREKTTRETKTACW